MKRGRRPRWENSKVSQSGNLVPIFSSFKGLNSGLMCGNLRSLPSTCTQPTLEWFSPSKLCLCRGGFVNRKHDEIHRVVTRVYKTEVLNLSLFRETHHYRCTLGSCRMVKYCVEWKVELEGLSLHRCHLYWYAGHLGLYRSRVRPRTGSVYYVERNPLLALKISTFRRFSPRMCSVQKSFITGNTKVYSLDSGSR